MKILEDINFCIKPARAVCKTEGYQVNSTILQKYTHENILWFPKAGSERKIILQRDLDVSLQESLSSTKLGDPNFVEIKKNGKKLILYDLFGCEKEVFPQGLDSSPNWKPPPNLSPFLSNSESAGLPIHFSPTDCFDFVDLNTLSKITPSSKQLKGLEPAIMKFWDYLLDHNKIPSYSRSIATEPEGVIFNTHLGFGDQIICFGFIQHLSENFNKVLVPCHEHNKAQLDYAFQENPKVEFHSISSTGSWRVGSLNFTKDNPNFRPVVAGGENNMVFVNHNFAPSFYHFWRLSYGLSLSKFRLPEFDERQDLLADHLKNIYNITGDYSICSVEWSGNKDEIDLLKLDLKEHQCKHPLIYIKQSENIFHNMFLLKKLILGAKQVFFIDSAFAHFLERINYQGEAYLVTSGQQTGIYKHPKFLKGKPYPFLWEVYRLEKGTKGASLDDWRLKSEGQALRNQSIDIPKELPNFTVI